MIPEIDPNSAVIADCSSGATADSDEVVWMLRRAEQKLTEVFDRECVKVGLRDVRDTLVLAASHRNEHQNQSEIARALAIDKTTLLVIIDRLEKEGWLVRESLSSNRRVKIPRTTDSGKDKLDEANALGRIAVNRVLLELPPHDLESLRSVLWQIGRMSVR